LLHFYYIITHLTVTQRSDHFKCKRLCVSAFKLG